MTIYFVLLKNIHFSLNCALFSLMNLYIKTLNCFLVQYMKIRKDKIKINIELLKKKKGKIDDKYTILPYS